MYAVIKTGGKQYRVQPGDLLVVEKLAGEPGASVDFGEVLMLGEGEAVTVGAPVVAGAKVAATLIETRKGEKVKVFKKIRRQGYRRTRGHRQWESVLRVTAITGDGREAKWDGEVNLTPKAVLDARARGLNIEIPAAAAPAPAAEAAPKKARAKAAPAADAEAVAASPEVQQAMASAEVNAPVETAAKPAKAKKAPASEAVAASPEAEAKPKKAAAPKAAKAEGEAEPKKAAPKKAAPKKDKDAE